jgi:hypothetical protein
MRTIKIAAIAAVAVLSTVTDSFAQNGSSGNPQSDLRSRLPFSRPMNASNGQMRTNSAMRPTTGVANYGAMYRQWARRGYQGGMTSPSTQSYPPGAGTMTPLQRQNVFGVGANIFNPANPNSQQSEFTGQPASEDYGWMDVETTAVMGRRTGDVNSAGSTLPNNNTANATNVQGYTGAAVPGADQVATPGNAVTPSAQSMNQQPSEWRIYQTPLMDRPSQQTQQSTTPSSGATSPPAQGQRPSGVSRAATGGPIKY